MLVWQDTKKLLSYYKLTEGMPPGFLGKSFKATRESWHELLRVKQIPVGSLQSPLLSYLKRWVGAETHPHIANAYNVFQEDDNIFLVTQYVQGDPLSSEKHSFDLAQSLQIAIQLANTLYQSHTKGLYHGNLKPNNIIIKENTWIVVQDFTGTLNGNWQTLKPHELQQQMFLDDLTGYAKIFASLFYNKEFSEDLNEKKDLRWPEATWVDAILEECCLQKINEQQIDDKTFLNLSQKLQQIHHDLYDKIATSYWVLPERWLTESHSKSGLTLLDNHKKQRLKDVWEELAKHHSPSMRGAWNWHLLHFQEGLLDLEHINRYFDEYEMQISPAIIAAQSSLKMNLGLQLFPAMKKVKRFLATSKESELLRVLGKLWLQVGKWEKAEIAFRGLWDEHQELDDFWCLAVALFHQNKYEDIKSLPIPSKDFPQYKAMQNCLELLAGKESAIEAFTTLKEESPEVTYECTKHLADFYSGQGIYSEREETWADDEKARELYSGILKENISSVYALCSHITVGGEKIDQDTSCQKDRLRSWTEASTFEQTSMITSLAVNNCAMMALSGDCDGNIFLWDLKKKEIRCLLVGHQKHITDLAMSEDGCWGISGSWDQNVYLWNLETTEHEEIGRHKEKVSCVAMTPDGSIVASGGWDGHIKIWSRENHELIRELELEDRWVVDLAISPDGKNLISCNQLDQAQVWSVETGEIITEISGSSVLVASADEILLASSSEMYLWNLKAKKTICSIPLREKVFCLSILPEYSLALTRNEDEVLEIWNLREGYCMGNLTALEAVGGAILDRRTLVTASGNEFFLWEDMESRAFPIYTEPYFLPPELEQAAKPMEFLQTKVFQAKTHFLQGDYEAAEKEFAAIRKIPGYEKNPPAQRGSFLCRRAENTPFHHLKSCQPIKTIPYPNHIQLCALHSDTGVAITAGGDDDLVQWNIGSGLPLFQHKNSSRYFSCLELSPSSEKFFTGAWDGEVAMHCVYTEEKTTIAKLDSAITSLRYNASSDVLAFSTKKECQVVSLKTMETTNVGTQENLDKVYLDDRGHHLLICSTSGKVRVYSIADKTVVQSFDTHLRKIKSGAIWQDNFYTASFGGEVFVTNYLTGERHTSAKLLDRPLKIWALQKNTVLVMTDYHALEVWHLEHEQCLSSHSIGKATSFAMSHDYRYLLVSEEGRKLALWQMDWEWDD